MNCRLFGTDIRLLYGSCDYGDDGGLEKNGYF